MRLQKRCFTLVISLFLAAALLIQGQPSLAAELSEQTSVETEEVQEELAGEPEEEQELSEEITGEEGQDAGEDADQEDLELEEYLEMARTELKEITAQDVVMALVYLCDSYQVRKTADAEGEVCVSIPTGTTVEIIGMDVDADLQLWFQVSLSWKDTSYTGYIQTGYLAYSNEKLMEWENMYFPQVMLLSEGNYPDVEQFPASYQNKLTQLKKAHPNWVFVKQNTGLDWQTVIKNENTGERSLIQTKMGSAYTNGAHGQPGWSYASEAAIKYYMDPRNFLDETRVFMFEQLTYNPSYHTQSAVQNILNSTFMKGSIPGDSKTYAAAFFDIGSTLKVSPFHLACRVYQEQGKGQSALISGTYSGYEGYYNYYNIKASGSSNKAIIENGLTYAKQQGWNSRYKSLQGGAKILSQNYILKGQDTLYLQKYDVDNSYNGLYAHQYMQNIMAPYTESSMVKSAYQSTGAINNSFVFKIPVYLNMPSAACAKPGSTPAPTVTPTATPSATPTATPSATPTATPSATPTAKPTATAKATPEPTATPTAAPTAKATQAPTAKPTATAKATQAPTAKPTATAAPTPVGQLSLPSPEPIPEGNGTASETQETEPVTQPTQAPTAEPTAVPVTEPLEAPEAENTEKGNAIVTAATPKPQTLSEDPAVLNMDMSATGVIYAETLEQIRDQKTKVVLDVGNGVKWAIDGAEIEEGPMSSMDLRVTMGEGATRIPAERIEALTGGEEYVELSLAHEGSFGLKAVLTVTLDQAMEGQYANLFYYNEAEEAFEYICAAQISSRKEAAFVLGHASDYIIVISDRTREDLLTERAQQMEEADQAIEEIMSRPAEQRPAKDKNKAALIIALILLASAAIGIGAYLIFKKDRDE